MSAEPSSLSKSEPRSELEAEGRAWGEHRTLRDRGQATCLECGEQVMERDKDRSHRAVHIIGRILDFYPKIRSGAEIRGEGVLGLLGLLVGEHTGRTGSRERNPQGSFFSLFFF